MKITNQSIPPDMAQAFSRLVSTTATGANAGAIARTRRAARISPGKNTIDPKENDFSGAVALLLSRLTMTPQSPGYGAAMRARLAEINTRNTATP